MKAIVHELQTSFSHLLKNVTDFTEEEIETLFSLLSWSAIDPRFSIIRVQQASKGKNNRKKLTKLLIKYATVQDALLQGLIHETVTHVGYRSVFYMALDDQLVPKRGKRIHGALKWYDHNKGRPVRALCLVDLALIIQGQAIFVLPYLLLETKTPSSLERKNQSKKKQQQDAKTAAAIQLMTQMIGWLDELGVRRKKMGVLTDAWYSNQRFLSFVREMKVKFRIVGKKNFKVLIPDHKRIQRWKKGSRGRPPTRYVKERRVDEYFRKVTQHGSFVEKKSGKRVQWKSAEVTLNSGGRTRIFRFWREDCKDPVFILTPAGKTRRENAETVYQTYSWRWRIEECHRDLKQQFGLGKLRNRTKEVVVGFLGLIYTYYSLFLLTRRERRKRTNTHITAPQFQDELISIMYAQKGGIIA